MSSKVAEADRYLKTQQQDNDTEEKHSLTIQYSTVEFSQVVVNNMQLSFRCFKPKNSTLKRGFNQTSSDELKTEGSGGHCWNT